MKIYKCDNCGREEPEPYGYDLFNEGGWVREWYDKNGEPVHFYYDDKLKKYYAKQQVAAVKHFCFACTCPPII